MFQVFIVLGALFILPVTVVGQTLVDIYGIVKDARSNELLPNVMITIPGTEVKVVSDARGRFRMVNNSPGMLLAIFADGYKMQFRNFLPGKMYYYEISLKPGKKEKNKSQSILVQKNEYVSLGSPTKSKNDSLRTVQ